MKYITRVLILLAIFAGAVWYMGHNMTEEQFTVKKTQEMGESEFPVVGIIKDGTEINLMSGYADEVNASMFRESMTPITVDGAVQVAIHENGAVVKKVGYEVYEVGGEEVLSSGTASTLEEKENQKLAQLRLDGRLTSGKEYVLRLIVEIEEGKTLSYFTRVKVLEESYLKEGLSFIQTFHKATFDKEEMKKYSAYLEPTEASTPKSLLNVTIKSPMHLISWGTMEPKVLSDIVPTVKEINRDILSVELSYLVQGSLLDEEGNVLQEENTYEVREFYRIRYTSDRIYLLKFERSMDAVFDMNTFSVKNLDSKNKQINLGFTSEVPEIKSTGDNQKLAFVDHSTLWYYDLEKNEVVEVLSLRTKETEYYQDGYSNNDIRILRLYESGNMDFIAYGYLNRGEYEGKMGLVLYKYYAESNRIEEQLFLPSQVPFEILEKNLDGLYYLSGIDTFYFSMDNVIYAYSLITKKLTVIAENVTSDSFLLSEEGQFIAWQNASNPKKSTEIHILKLETEERFTIEAPSGKSILLLENSNSNFVYGYANTKDIVSKEDGTVITPMYQIEIADANKTIIKTYLPKEGYVSDVVQKGARLEITLVKKSGSSYSKNGSDFIMNRIENSTATIYSRTDTIAKDLVRVSIVLPSSFEAEEDPKIVVALDTEMSEETRVQVQEKETKEQKFYSYVSGHLSQVYDSAAEAIQEADAGMGVVVDNLGHLVWERGETDARAQISGIQETVTGNGITSTGACVSMMLTYTGAQADAKALSESSKSMYALLETNLGHTPVNLTGSTLSQVLYYVSHNRPIIAMKNGSDAVLIVSYDEGSITYIDPAAKTTKKLGMTASTKLFEEAGNVFISYVE